MTAERKLLWQGPAKLQVGRRKYKKFGDLIVPVFGTKKIFSGNNKPDVADNLQKSKEKIYHRQMDIEKKLKNAFNILDFLSDNARELIDKIARDDVDGNFSVDNYVSGDRRAEWRQAEAERIRGIRARMPPEKIEEERAKAAARMRALRQKRQATP